MLYHTFYIDITSLHHLITLYQRRYYDIAIWYYGHFPDTRRFKIHLVILNNFILVIILSRSDWILEENTLLDFTRTLFLLSLFDILPPFSFIGAGGGHSWQEGEHGTWFWINTVILGLFVIVIKEYWP